MVKFASTTMKWRKALWISDGNSLGMPVFVMWSKLFHSGFELKSNSNFVTTVWFSSLFSRYYVSSIVLRCLVMPTSLASSGRYLSQLKLLTDPLQCHIDDKTIYSISITKRLKVEEKEELLHFFTPAPSVFMSCSGYHRPFTTAYDHQPHCLYSVQVSD